MAQPPLSVYGLDVNLSAVGVLTVLYWFAAQADMDRYQDRKGPAPFVVCDANRIEEILKNKLKRTQVFVHLKALREAGAIVPERDGWRLLLRDLPETDSQQRSSTGDDRGEQLSADRTSGNIVRKTGLIHEAPENSLENRTARPHYSLPESGEIVRSASEQALENRTDIPETAEQQYGLAGSRSPINQLNSEQPELNQARLNSLNLSVNSRAKPGTDRAFKFVVTVAELYVPIEPERRLSPGDPEHMRLASQLLHVSYGPEDISFDAMARVANERYESCLGILVDFAEMCRTNWNDQARHWRPWMLSMEKGKSAKMSPWRATELNVIAWRRERREQESSQAAQAKLAAQTEAAAITARLEALEASQGAWDNRFVRELQDKVKGWTPPMALRDAGQVARALAAARRVVDDAVKAGRAPRLAEVERAISSVYETAQLPAAAPAPPDTALQAAAQDTQAESVQEMAKRLAGARQAGSRMRDDAAATQRAEQMQVQINRELLAERNKLNRVLTQTEAEAIRTMVRERWKQ